MGRAQRAHRPGEGARLSSTDAAALWGLAEYENLAQRFAPVHDLLVERLAPRPGERWLDVATGTGEVAVRAAAAGADVTGVDIAPGLLELARAKAPGIRFELGDAQALSYDAGSFDVVSSSFGLIFAPDHEAVAGELGRICRGRMGLTAWEPLEELRDLYASFDLVPPEGRAPFEWGKRDYVEGLLSADFSLEIESHTWYADVSSGEELWELWSGSAPPFKAMIEELEPGRREAFHAAFVEYGERHREGDRVRPPRPYLLVLGHRR